MIETFRKIWSFSGKQHGKLAATLALSFARSTLGITQILGILAAVNVITGSCDARDGITAVIVMAVICVAGNFAVSFFEQIRSVEIGMYMTADQRIEIGDKLKRMPLGFFSRNTAEKIITVLTGTLQGVESGAAMTIVGIISGFFNSAAILIFMLIYDAGTGRILAAGIVIYMLVVTWQLRRTREDAPERQKAQSRLSAASLVFMKGIRIIKSFSCRNGDEELISAINGSRDANIALTRRSMPSQYAAHISIALAETAILLYTVYNSVETGAFGPEKAVLLIIISFVAYASLDQAGSILSMIGLIESGLSEVAEIKAQEELDEKIPGTLPEDENIYLKNVDFSYGDNKVLRNVSAGFRSGELTAVIGPSGSGKTTLCRMIARFQDPDSGKVMMGGTDVRDIPYEKLMEKVSIVFQNVYLFEDTILNNIRLGRPDAGLEEVREAAVKARCDDLIMALPDGYDTVLQEGGSNLSGGEKQRISIARAILKDSPVIILDEATSALDVENEKRFFEAVDQLVKDKTVIMIAHRLSTLRHADRIIALDGGEVVQEGTPEELAGVEGIYSGFISSRENAAGWALR